MMKNLILLFLTLYTFIPISSRELRKRKCDESSNSTVCTRDVWSIMNENTDWPEHPFHNQVWYHTLDNIHSLWQKGYFEYVLDIRPLQNTTLADGTVLEGWEEFHIPDSFPITVFPPDTPAAEVDMLVDFASSNVCKDSRVFVHCWSGIAGNMVAKTLIELGFTNVHAAGPQGSSGMWAWKDNGWAVTYKDTFDAGEESLQPACIDACAN